MTQEEKDLLLKDLCGRLPYGVKVSVNQSQLQNYDPKWKNWGFEEEPEEIDGVSIYGVTFGCMDMSDGVIGFEFIKPYLFPLSSMTEEQFMELKVFANLTYEGNTLELVEWNDNCKTLEFWLEEIPSYCVIKVFNWLNKNHFDYQGLIEKGLALDATGLKIY